MIPAAKAKLLEGKRGLIVGIANETNRLANGYQIEIDEQFKEPMK